MKIILLWLMLVFPLYVSAQRFVSNYTDLAIPDFRENVIKPLVVEFNVSGLSARIDHTFGFEKLQLAIRHPYISDIKVELYSPNGTMVWITNRHGRDGDHYLETVFAQNGFRGQVAQGEAPFTGAYIPDGRLATLNNGQNPNGVWKLHIYDLKTGDVGTFNGAILFFSTQPAVEQLPRCSLNHPQNCNLPTTSRQLLPDLTLIPAVTRQENHEAAFSEQLGHGILRFGVSTMNIGNGPLEIRGTGIWKCGNKRVIDAKAICANGTYPRQDIQQWIYTLNRSRNKIQVTKRKAGTNAYDARPGHEHFHADDFVSYTLLEKTDTSDFRQWKVIGKGIKASFCIWDLGFCRDDLQNCVDEKNKLYTYQNLPNYGFKGYTTCEEGVQGLSVGGVDYYGEHFEGQLIELPKGTRNGSYYLHIKVDPNNLYEEADETNNEIIYPIQLQKQKNKQ